MSSQKVYDFSYEQKAVVWLRVVHRLTVSSAKINAAFCE